MSDHRPRVEFHDRQITMSHGAGGEASRRLIEGLFLPAFSNPLLDSLSDASIFEPPQGRIAVTTDSYVVQPLAFPGGSIGELAINGTVNDLAMAAAQPVVVTVAFVLEAGLSTEVLRREIAAMSDAARRANVLIAAGDTKVVEHGKCDGMYITTTGIGEIDRRANLGPQRVQPGDQILISGPIANHGIAILLARAELNIEADIRSDTRLLTDSVMGLLDAAGDGLKWMRDATRGGVATVLNELARDAQQTLRIEEEAIPLDDAVRGACELLGLDPLQVANEGQFIAVVAREDAQAALSALKKLPGGERAGVLGEVLKDKFPRVLAHSAFGGVRVVDMLIGDPLPRIC